MNFEDCKNKSTEELFKALDTSASGLAKKEAAQRLKEFGLNEIKAKRTGIAEILWRQFKSPFFYLLFIAVIISFFVGERIDSLALLLFIVANVVIGFFQEYRAEHAVFLLRKIVPQKVKILRPFEGQKASEKEEIGQRQDLVPGDVILLEAGDIVPADARIIKAHNFLADESLLTGESLPSQKTDKDCVFTGTSVISGRAEAVVFGTGKNTALGEIAGIVSSVKRESAYEKSILYFCRLILKIVATTIILIFVANMFVKGFGAFFDLLLFSVALIVSILPEALPAVVTFALSQGSLKMAKESVVVKRLSAIEDLGNIEILCTDKTGTLTKNMLSLEEIVSSDKRKCFLYGALALGRAEKRQKLLNPFDKAFFERVSEDILSQAKKFKIVSELPFDSSRMKSSIIAEDQKGEKVLVVKGAPEFILKNCAKMGGRFDKKEIKEEVEREGQEGRRVLAIAYKKLPKEKEAIANEDEKGLTFLGYFVFEDPLKPHADEAIKLAKKLGVNIKIITGDSKEVAEYVAKKAGLASAPHEVISGEELEKLVNEDFDYACEEKTVFARISPQLKHKIIKSLEKKYEVGFMGEGANDAPALKTANVGIAVAEASDIAREASDVVLLQKDLRVVVNGIKDGRTIFSNINKYIKCALASNFGNFYSIAVISLFVNFLPMLPVQILLGNLLSDFPLISIATDSVDVEELRKPKMYQLHMVLPLIISLALVSTIFDFIFFGFFFKQAPAVIQTLWFIESILTEILLIFIIRTRHLFYKAVRPSFWLILFTIIDGIFVVALPFLPFGKSWFHFVAPPLWPLLTVFFLISSYFVTSEFIKLIYFRYFKPFH